MKNLARNKRKFAYCLYTGHTPLYDANGLETGEYKLTYSAPVECYGNISPATGQSVTEQFGNLENYDKVIALDDVNTPIDEESVLFIDKPYEQDADGNPMFDYIVGRVARSLNQVSIAITKVKVSGTHIEVSA